MEEEPKESRERTEHALPRWLQEVLAVVRYLFSLKNFLGWITFALATVFIRAASAHAKRDFPMGLLSLWGSPQIVLYLSPAVIFVITVVAYYRYVIDYTAEVAGLSFAGFLAALYCCIELLETPPNNWEDHLKWVYLLFLSYVVWDSVMLAVFLPSAKDRRLARADEREVRILTMCINWPTLIALLGVWFGAKHFIGHNLESSVVPSYVEGVIAFHLVFASCACAITMCYNWLRKLPHNIEMNRTRD